VEISITYLFRVCLEICYWKSFENGLYLPQLW